MTPEVKYAKSGGVHIAYSEFGEGPWHLIIVPGWVSNLGAIWQFAPLAHFYERLSKFCRVIAFDKRGTGMSDRDGGLPTLEDRMDDVRAVQDAVGIERASLFGISEGGCMAMLFAATYPSRTNTLTVFGSYAKRVWSLDYPWAPTPEQRQNFYDGIVKGWQGEMDLSTTAPSLMGNPERIRQFSNYARSGASPSAALALARLNTHIDVRNVLPSIRVPTLIMHRAGDLDVNVEEGRYLAQQIPSAKFIEYPGDDHVPFVGNVDAVLDDLQEFLTGQRPIPEGDRVLATVMISDIVGSTKLAASMGDRAWVELLRQHDALVAECIEANRGRLVKSTGDGVLAVFDGPARATRCAQRIAQSAPSLGLEVRIGLHCGEIELRGSDVAGLGVHIASRVASEAGEGEVLVTRTIKDLTSGAGLNLVERGEATLAGVPDPWLLYSVA